MWRKGQPLIYTRHMAVGSYSPCTKSHFFHLNQHIWLPYARMRCQISVIQSSLFNIYVSSDVWLENVQPPDRSAAFVPSAEKKKFHTFFKLNLKPKSILCKSFLLFGGKQAGPYLLPACPRWRCRHWLMCWPCHTEHICRNKTPLILRLADKGETQVAGELERQRENSE